jgi:CRP-like cAMP-binding protein
MVTIQKAGADRDAILALIRDWKWFAFVPSEAHEWLADHSRIHKFIKGDHVYRSGDPASHIYGVLSGVFRIYFTAMSGDEVTGEELVTGSWFPHMVASKKPEYYGNCVCQQDAVVVEISQSAITEFSERWPGYFKGLYREMTDRGPATISRIMLLTLHTLNVRLAVYLLRMARLRGVLEANGSIFIAGEVSQTELGSRVGGTRQRINSLLMSWVKKGWIELSKDGTRIIDIKQLTTEAKTSGFELEEYLAGWHGGWQGKQ